MIDNVKPDPRKSICLYEESDNFDSTVQVKAQPQTIDINNINDILNSESLE